MLDKLKRFFPTPGWKIEDSKCNRYGGRDALSIKCVGSDAPAITVTLTKEKDEVLVMLPWDHRQGEGIEKFDGKLREIRDAGFPVAFCFQQNGDIWSRYYDVK